MRQSAEDNEDERGLLTEKWQKRTDRADKGKKVDWIVVGVVVICFITGIALGRFSHRITPALSEDQDAEKVESNETAQIPAIVDDEKTIVTNVHSLHFPPNLPITFNPNEVFSNISNPKIDFVWQDLLPKGRGFVQIDDDGNGIHYHGEKQNVTRTKVIAAFHQFHCLNMIRKSIYASVDHPETFRYLVPQLSIHWTHCFDYLRQVFMCNMDLTLESLKKQGETVLTEVDGWGTEHMCRDFSKVFKWAETHRATDDEGFD